MEESVWVWGEFLSHSVAALENMSDNRKNGYVIGIITQGYGNAKCAKVVGDSYHPFLH